MKTIVFLVAVWKRHPLSAIMLRYIDGLMKPGDRLLVVGSPDDVGWFGVVPLRDATAINAPNEPLGSKWQAGVSCARTTRCDALMMLGSDDFPSSQYVDNVRGAIEHGADVVGLLGCTQWRPADNLCVRVPGYPQKSPRHGEPIGSGRSFSRALLDRLDWHLFDPVPRFLDANLWAKIPQNAVKKIGSEGDLGCLLDVRVDVCMGAIEFGEGVVLADVTSAGIPMSVIQEISAQYPRIPGWKPPARAKARAKTIPLVSTAADAGWVNRRGAIVDGRSEGQFPLELLRPTSRVLDLYCAGFLGKNTASFCADVGVAAYEGVDMDVAKLEQMKLVYPMAWRFFQAKVLPAMSERIERGELYDMVIADPWTNAIAGAWEMMGIFKKLLSPGGVLLLGSTNAEKEAHPEHKYHWRSDHAGGIWWAIIR